MAYNIRMGVPEMAALRFGSLMIGILIMEWINYTEVRL